jgi:DNA-binding CsgD family transcriptional regulator/DNA-binding transcriptional ArsR family regulator
MGDTTGTPSETLPKVPALGRWGLSPHADLIYRSLVQSGPTTRRRLISRLGVPARRVDRALDELVGVGAVNPAEGEGSWSAIDAELVVSRMRRRRAPVPLADRHRHHLAAVADLYLDRLPAATVQWLPTRTAVRSRIAELAATERHEHLAINTEDVISAEAAAAAGPLDRALVARGVRLRTLGLIARDGGTDPTFVRGIEHRQARALPLKLMVFDRRSAIFPADPVHFVAGAVEIDDAGAVAHLIKLFYRFWEKAEVPGAREVPPIALTRRERTIVSMLAAGVSEQAAAAELGVSRRTVVYTIRALMDRLAVENRFQLALMLGTTRTVTLPHAMPTGAHSSPR